MACELITDFKRLCELSDDWRRWTRSDPSATIFQSWEWARAFWKTYGDDLLLRSIAVSMNGRLQGILPLVQRGNTIEFLGAPHSDYNDILCDEGATTDVLEEALEFMLRCATAWDFMILEKVPQHSKIFRSASLLSEAARRHVQTVFRCPSSAVVVDSNPEILGALIAKEQLARYERKLRKSGELSFRHFEGRDEARQHLEPFFHQHVTRWAMADERSEFLKAEFRVFFESLVEELDLSEQLRFGVLELDSRPLAYHFGFKHNGTLTWYKPAFDVNYWDYCPGDVLVRNLLVHVRTAALKELDFTLGDEPFKLRFANRVRNNYIMYVERHPERIASRARWAVRVAQDALRNRPALKWALKTRIRQAKQVTRRLRILGRHVLQRNSRGGWRGTGHDFRLKNESLVWAGPSNGIKNGCGVTIAPATLDDIVSLSVQFGQFLTGKDLHAYRRLLKSGGKPFIAQTCEGHWFVLLMGRRLEGESLNMKCEQRLPSNEPVFFIEECWKVPERSHQYLPPEILRALVSLLAGKELRIHNAEGDGALTDQRRQHGSQTHLDSPIVSATLPTE